MSFFVQFYSTCQGLFTFTKKIMTLMLNMITRYMQYFLSRSEDSLPKKCPFLDFLWSVFFCFWTEYADLQSKSPYLLQKRENTNQKFFKYKHLLGSNSLNNKTNQHRVFKSNIIVGNTFQAKFFFLYHKVLVFFFAICI